MKTILKPLILLLLAALLCLVIVFRLPTATPSPAPTPAPTPSEAPTPPPTPTPTPPPSFDETPEKGEAAVTVNGTELSAVYEKDGVPYVKLAELLSAAKPGEAPELYTGVTDHYTVDASCGDLAVHCDNRSLDLLVGEYGNVLNADPWVMQGSARYDGTDWFVPTDACSALGFTLYNDEAMNHSYYTRIPLVPLIPQGIKVPVLMYHAVSDDCWGLEGLFVSPSEMDKQLQYLSENGYTTIWFEDLPYIDQIEKPVLLTFDDGYEDNYTELFPLLQKYNAKATIFVISSALGTGHIMTAEQVQELSASGLVSIQSHTHSHRELSGLDAETLDAELASSVAELTRLTGKQPFVVCYPSGRYNELAVSKVEEYFSLGTIIDGETYVTGVSRRGAIPRLRIPRDMGIAGFAATIRTAGEKA